ncbi:MAG: L,D-transpeptidase family protein [Solirubrobacteraceae bacterium]
MGRTDARWALLAAAALPAAPALAQAPAAPAPAPAPVQTQMTLTLERVGGIRSTVLTGSHVRVRGTVGAYVPNETVTVRISSSGHKVLAKHVAIEPDPSGSGGFELSYRATRIGRLVVRAAHDPTPVLGALAATGRSVDVLPRRVGRRSGRSAVRALQRRLRGLGYVVGAPGAYDARTARAVLAFRKVTRMVRRSEASSSVMRAIARGAGGFEIRRPEHGRHVEADLSRQVIALVANGGVQRIYPVSSGKPSTPTVVGSFQVYLKTPGTNAKGMVNSAYFFGAYATHGYPSVPAFPASHGCLRVPISDARSLFRWIRVGTPVDVYR